MKMLVLGAGLQGSACAFDLLTHTDAEVTLADVNPANVAGFAKSAGGKRLRIERLDARDEDSVRRLMEGHAAAMSALPARILGLEAEGWGRLDHGARADLIVVEPGAHDLVDTLVGSRAPTNPCLGMTTRARVRATVVGGETAYRWESRHDPAP